MPRINRTLLVVSDYEEIWKYIAKNDVSAADRLIARFEQHLKTLAASPRAGKTEFHFADELRSFPVGSYLLFYRPQEDGIELIRVLHGARDITQEFFE